MEHRGSRSARKRQESPAVAGGTALTCRGPEQYSGAAEQDRVKAVAGKSIRSEVLADVV